MRYLPVLLSVLAGATPVVVRAQSPLDEARSAYEAAEFRRALELLDAAQQSVALDRVDYVHLLELRTLSYLALGEDDGTERTLRVLASVEPEHRFGPEAPPDLVERFATVRDALPGPIAIEGHAVPSPGGATVEARVARDPERIVGALRIHARVHGGSWQTADSETLAVAAAPGDRIEWFVEAVGPGGAILASVASSGEPRVATLPPPAPDVTPQRGGEENGTPWTWIAVGGGALVVVGVVLALILGSSGDDTDVQLELEW